MSRWFCAIFLLLYVGAATADDWPQLSLPPDARIGTLGDDLTFNGMRTRVYGIQFYQDIDQMKKFYQAELARLSSRKPVIVPTDAGGVMITQFDGRFVYNITLAKQTSNSSTATVMIGDQQEKAIKPYGVKFPDHTNVLSDLESIDDGKYGRSLMLSSKLEYKLFKRDMLSAMAKAGYAMESDYYQKNPKKNLEEFYFRGEGTEAQLIMGPDRSGGTSAHLIIVKPPK